MEDMWEAESRAEQDNIMNSQESEIDTDKGNISMDSPSSNSVDRMILQNGQWIRNNIGRPYRYDQVNAFDPYIRFKESYKGEIKVRVILDFGDKILKKESSLIKLMSFLHMKGIGNISKSEQKTVNRIDLTFSNIQMANKCLETVNSKNKGGEFIVKGHIYKDISFRKGIISDWDRDSSLEELAEAIGPNKDAICIEKIQRKYKDKNGEIKFTPVNAILIIFKSKELPKSIALYENVISIKIRPYVENVIQCFKCFKFGHFAKYWC